MDEQTIDDFALTTIRYRKAGDWWQLTPSVEERDADDRGHSQFGGDTMHIISPVYSHDIADVLGTGDDMLDPDTSFVLRRYLDLGAVLEAETDRVGPAIGVAPDLSYGEQSLAVWGITRDRAIAIGLEFHQLAIFEIDKHTVRVVGCMGEGVVTERPFLLELLGTRPCAMGDLDDPDHPRQRCAPPDDGDATDHQQATATWVGEWQRRYGLLGCDVCGGTIPELAP
jgi:hypothetical protein